MISQIQASLSPFNFLLIHFINLASSSEDLEIPTSSSKSVIVGAEENGQMCDSNLAKVGFNESYLVKMNLTSFLFNWFFGNNFAF